MSDLVQAVLAKKTIWRETAMAAAALLGLLALQ